MHGSFVDWFQGPPTPVSSRWSDTGSVELQIPTTHKHPMHTQQFNHIIYTDPLLQGSLLYVSVLLLIDSKQILLSLPVINTKLGSFFSHFCKNSKPGYKASMEPSNLHWNLLLTLADTVWEALSL